MAQLDERAKAELIEQTQLMAAIDPGKPYTLEEFKDCHSGKLVLVSSLNLTLAHAHTHTVEKKSIYIYIYAHVHRVRNKI